MTDFEKQYNRIAGLRDSQLKYACALFADEPMMHFEKDAQVYGRFHQQLHNLKSMALKGVVL